jgi:RNA polymerase sigma-70 factor (ECF subfamily)
MKSCERSMFRVARSILRTDAECADAMQETVVRAYKAIRRLKEPLYFKTWLIRILMNECRRMYKRHQRVIPMADPAEEAAYHPEWAESLTVIEAVCQLDEELRAIVALYYLEDMPLKEVAQLLDLPEGTVKSRLARSREKLARFLEPVPTIATERRAGHE